MPIAIRAFSGEIPRVSKRLLPPSAAQTALNCRVWDGPLEPINVESLIHTFPAPVASFTYHNGAWIGFDAQVDVVPGPVADDRLYVTGDNAPKMVYGATTRELALPAPALAPTVVPDHTAQPQDPSETMLWAYTCITDLGEESPPSPVTDAYLLYADSKVTLSGFAVSAANRGITGFRIYRSQTSITGVTDLYFIKEVTINEASVGVIVGPGDPIGETLKTSDFTPPPATMAGIIAAPNGILAAHDGRELLFCEPYVPYAWPSGYRLLTEYPIVGLCAFGTSIAVMTTGTPYRAQGTHPDNMQLDQVEEMAPCLSARGIVDLGYAAAYPSSDGLVVISASGAKNVTRNLFKRAQWEALNPDTFIAAYFDGKYFFSHIPDGQSNRRLGIIDLMNLETPAFVNASTIADDLYHDIQTGNLYVLIGNAALYRWDMPDEEPKSYEWKSAAFQQPFPINFTVFRAEGSMSAKMNPAFAAEIWADGVLRHTVTSLNETHRLPSGFLAEQWEIRITGNATIDKFTLAESLSDLGTVP